MNKKGKSKNDLSGKPLSIVELNLLMYGYADPELDPMYEFFRTHPEVARHHLRLKEKGKMFVSSTVADFEYFESRDDMKSLWNNPTASNLKEHFIPHYTETMIRPNEKTMKTLFPLETDDFSLIKDYLHSGECESLKLRFDVLLWRWVYVAMIRLKVNRVRGEQTNF